MKVRVEQARRLRILREALGLSVVSAYQMAGLNDRHTWQRMEHTGDKNRPVLAPSLHKFLAEANRIYLVRNGATFRGAEYVIMGEYDGLPKALLSDVQARESELAADSEAEADSELALSGAPSGTPQTKGSRSTGRKSVVPGRR